MRIAAAGLFLGFLFLLNIHSAAGHTSQNYFPDQNLRLLESGHDFSDVENVNYDQGIQVQDATNNQEPILLPDIENITDSLVQRISYNVNQHIIDNSENLTDDEKKALLFDLDILCDRIKNLSTTVSNNEDYRSLFAVTRPSFDLGKQLNLLEHLLELRSSIGGVVVVGNQSSNPVQTVKTLVNQKWISKNEGVDSNVANNQNGEISNNTELDHTDSIEGNSSIEMDNANDQVISNPGDITSVEDVEDPEIRVDVNGSDDKRLNQTTDSGIAHNLQDSIQASDNDDKVIKKSEDLRDANALDHPQTVDDVVSSEDSELLKKVSLLEKVQLLHKIKQLKVMEALKNIDPMTSEELLKQIKLLDKSELLDQIELVDKFQQLDDIALLKSSNCVGDYSGNSDKPEFCDDPELLDIIDLYNKVELVNKLDLVNKLQLLNKVKQLDESSQEGASHLCEADCCQDANMQTVEDEPLLVTLEEDVMDIGPFPATTSWDEGVLPSLDGNVFQVLNGNLLVNIVNILDDVLDFDEVSNDEYSDDFDPNDDFFYDDNSFSTFNSEAHVFQANRVEEPMVCDSYGCTPLRDVLRFATLNIRDRYLKEKLYSTAKV